MYVKTHLVRCKDGAYGFVGDAVSKVLPDINPLVEYDLAISFMYPHNFIQDHVRDKKKMAWVHTDYRCIDVNIKKELAVWSSFDHIVSISHDVTKSFVLVFPSLKSKMIEIENILSSEYVRRRAEEFTVEKNDELTLLSIGRFCEAKNFDNVPDICKHIVEKGCNVKWYIIGYGSEEDIIRQKIVEAGMQNHVIILGMKENPYPYIKGCDIYVQPSRREGKNVAVREAMMLCKPVAITNYPTSSSQVLNGVDGVIVPLDNEECAKELVAFISDKSKQLHIVEYLKSHDYNNINEVDKIYKLVSI